MPAVSGSRRGRRRSWGSARKLPSGRWQARFVDPNTGDRVQHPSSFASKTDALIWLDMKRADLERGIATDDTAARRRLQDWWPGYLLSIKSRLRPSTVASYEQAWRLRVEPEFGGLEVRAIRPGMIDDWHLRLATEGVASTKIRQASGVLKRLLDRVVRDGALLSSPYRVKVEPLPPLPKKDHPVLEPTEVFELAGAMPNAEDALMTKTLMYMGLRVGEVMALQRRDVNAKAGTMTIRRSLGEDGKGHLVLSETKTGRERTLVMPAAFAKELSTHLSAQLKDSGPLPTKDALVFPNRSGGFRRYSTFRRDTWDKAVARVNAKRIEDEQQAAKKAGRPVRAITKLECTPHDLRATCASLLIDAGASVRDVADYLGHADITTTLGIYTRVRPGRDSDVASRMDRLVSSSVGAANKKPTRRAAGTR